MSVWVLASEPDLVGHGPSRNSGKAFKCQGRFIFLYRHHFFFHNINHQKGKFAGFPTAELEIDRSERYKDYRLNLHYLLCGSTLKHGSLSFINSYNNNIDTKSIIEDPIPSVRLSDTFWHLPPALLFLISWYMHGVVEHEACL